MRDRIASSDWPMGSIISIFMPFVPLHICGALPRPTEPSAIASFRRPGVLCRTAATRIVFVDKVDTALVLPAPFCHRYRQLRTLLLQLRGGFSSPERLAALVDTIRHAIRVPLSVDVEAGYISPNPAAINRQISETEITRGNRVANCLSSPTHRFCVSVQGLP